MSYRERNSRALAISLASAALCAGVANGQSIDADASAGAVCTEALLNRHSDAAETGALNLTGGRVAREGCNVRFRTPGGEHVLTSNLSEDAAHLGYVYRGTLPQGYDLVEVRYYERREYLIVDGAGLRKRYIVGEPVVSPDRQRVVATSLDLVAGIRPNALEIWRLEDRFVTLEFSIRSEEWGPSDATWVDAATIVFTQSFKPFGERKVTARLRLTSSGWSFEPGVASGR